MRRILILTMLVIASALPAQTLMQVLQTLETSLTKLDEGLTLVESGLTELRKQQTQLSAELDTLETASTELDTRQSSLEQSWTAHKTAVDVLVAAQDDRIRALSAELWLYRGGLVILAGLTIYILIR